MNTGFSTTHLGGRSLEVFQHDVCRIRYHTDVFWVTEAVGRDRIEELLDASPVTVTDETSLFLRLSYDRERYTTTPSAG
jgi:hypothetical protein